MNERDILAGVSSHTDPAARAAFLDAACGEDAGLRSRVEQLLHSSVTPVDSDESTRTFSQVHVPEGGRTRTLVPAAGHPDAPDGGAADLDLSTLLSPAQEEGSLGRLDHYEVLKVVGRGGMGVVVRAHDTRLRRIVAVKLLAPALAAVGTARKRFAREAQAAAAVREEHVVDIHAVYEAASVPYLVMEFVSGVTLEDRVRADGPLDPTEVVRIGLQSAHGLAAAHAQGLIHRDVKPSNILLEGGTGRVKLTDFGLARAADDASLSRSGVIAGTPMYMSPEQARGDKIDHRSDLFSLGSVLYTLLTGKPAFRAESTVAVLGRVCDDEARPIRESSPGVPRWVCAVVEKLMAKDPAERIQTASEVADLLTRYLAHAADPDRVPPPPPIRGVQAAAGRRWVRRWAIGAAVAAAAVAAFGYWAIRPANRHAAPTPERPFAAQTIAGWRPVSAEELAARPNPLDAAPANRSRRYSSHRQVGVIRIARRPSSLRSSARSNQTPQRRARTAFGCRTVAGAFRGRTARTASCLSQPGRTRRFGSGTSPLANCGPHSPSQSTSTPVRCSAPTARYWPPSVRTWTSPFGARRPS